MKLTFEMKEKKQPDPFIFEDGELLYLYVTAMDGVEAYVSDDLFGEWRYIGVVTEFAEGCDFWAPSVIKIEDTYYMYVSCWKEGASQFMHVASSPSPQGPFKNEKMLYDHFSIDSHMIQTDDGLFLWYAKNNVSSDKRGTRVFVDRFLDPYTPEYDPKEVLVPTFDEEIYENNWYTLEGPFWFQEGEWQYLMYSAGCYQNETYHIGYATAKSTETDFKKIDFVKHTREGGFDPVIIRNEFEEGTGHHSVIKYRGEYYAVYHGRDHGENVGTAEEKRTARVCKLTVKDGSITAERFEDHL